METQNFGDRLYSRVASTKSFLFLQGEMAQLTYEAYDKFVDFIQQLKEDTIPVTYPVGFNSSKKTITTTHNYSKEDLISRYQYLENSQLPINGIYQLVTLTEAMLSDILRGTLTEFPQKINGKKKFDAEIVLEARSMEEIKNSIVNSILNEFTYKSPKDFAEEFNKYVGVNLMEKPAFHKYVEIKATRDIYIHNLGVANEIYLSKANTLARVKAGEYLPVDITYFLESYECCLQLTEVLEKDLHKIWPSVLYTNAQKIQSGQTLAEEKEAAVDKIIEEAEEVYPTAIETPKTTSKKTTGKK